MFLYQQDIAMLHGAVISAQRGLSDYISNDDDLTSVQQNWIEMVQNVRDCVQVVSQVYKSGRHKYSQRMHAVLFYTTLRSNGIACDACDEFYECVMDVFPSFDWKFYVEVNRACEWSDQYIECVLQLPEKIATIVLQNTCKEVCNKSDDVYILHSVLQCIFKMLFRSDNNAANQVSMFRFAFESIDMKKINRGTTTSVLESDKVEDSNSIAIDSHNEDCNSSVIDSHNEDGNSASCYEVLDRLLIILNDSDAKITAVNIVLNGFITIFDLLLNYEKHRIPFMASEEIERYIFFAQKFLQTEAMYDLIKAELEKCNFQDFRTSKAKDISTGMDIVYAIFLVYSKWSELVSKFHEASVNVSPRIELFYTLNQLFEVLYSFHPFKIRENGPVLENCIKILIFIVNSKMEGMHYAVKTFLQDSILMERNDVIACLVENKSLISDHISHLMLLLDIMMKKPDFENYPLYNIFFQSLCQLPSAPCKILPYFLTKYQLSTHLKSERFEVDLASLLSRSVKLNKTKNVITVLCLQSARETIEKTVDRAVNSGIVGLIDVLIQVLETVSCVCAYEEALGKPKLLASILSKVLADKNVTPARLQNVPILIKGLLQVFDENVLPRFELLFPCIQVDLDNDTPNVIKNYYFQIFNIILENAVESGNLKCLKNFDMHILIVYLCKVINVCIMTFNGHLKETLVTIISTLANVHKKLKSDSSNMDVTQHWVEKSLSTMNLTVQFYALDFIPGRQIDISLLPLTHLLSWYCFRKEKNTFVLKEKIRTSATATRYIMLVLSLTQLLPHFTTNEFLHLSLTLEECVEAPFANEHLETFVHKCTSLTLSHGCRKVTEVTKLLVDAFLLLKKCKNIELNWTYMMSCLLQLIQNQLKNLEPAFRLVSCIMIFCEVCKLNEAFTNENAFGGVLLELSKELKKEMCDSKENEIVHKFLLAVILNLHDDDMKTNVIKVLQ